MKKLATLAIHGLFLKLFSFLSIKTMKKLQTNAGLDFGLSEYKTNLQVQKNDFQSELLPIIRSIIVSHLSKGYLAY